MRHGGSIYAILLSRLPFASTLYGVISGEVMAWYQVINAKSANYAADRDAEDLLRQFSAALRDADGPVDAEVFYGFARSGARIYYFSLSPEALDLAQQVLTSYDATRLEEPPDLTGMQKMRSV